jgi:VanZ family protein
MFIAGRSSFLAPALVTLNSPLLSNVDQLAQSLFQNCFSRVLACSCQPFLKHWSGFAWAVLVSVAMGTLVELAQGITGRGHYRLRDLIPDAAGIMVGFGIVYLWNRLRIRPT